MPLIDIDGINLNSPYQVHWGKSGHAITFSTTKGIGYVISFQEESGIFNGLVAFNLLLHSPNQPLQGNRFQDKKVQETVFCILNDFLSRDHRVVFYVCDLRDGRHEQRCRLFTLWAKRADKLFPERFVIEHVSYPDSIYGGVISRADNPCFKEYMEILGTMRQLGNDKTNV